MWSQELCVFFADSFQLRVFCSVLYELVFLMTSLPQVHVPGASLCSFYSNTTSLAPFALYPEHLTTDRWLPQRIVAECHDHLILEIGVQNRCM